MGTVLMLHFISFMQHKNRPHISFHAHVPFMFRSCSAHVPSGKAGRRIKIYWNIGNMGIRIL